MDNPIQEFYRLIPELELKLNESNSRIECLKNRFNDEMNLLDKGVKHTQSEMKKNFSKSTLSEFVSMIADEVAESISSWDKSQKEAVDRYALRTEAAKALLVIIYGKVKAGKSTLGNYIASQAPQKMSKKFFTFDEAGKEHKKAHFEELSEDGFAVKSTECTNAIQGFQLPGLMWIDTPGLLSTTKINGDLAKKYVEAADLIIYPISSDSPGRGTDTEELKELALKGKEFCVVITKSDRNEEDEIDGHIVNSWVNKSDPDRKKQEAYVRSEIYEKLKTKGVNHLQIGNIFSMSIKTAKEHELGSEEWKNSNVHVLFDMMNNIIKSDAYRLKSEAPIKNYQARIRGIIISDGQGSLVELNRKIVCQKNELSETQKQFHEMIMNLKEKCKPGIMGKIFSSISEGYKKKEDVKLLSARIGIAVQNVIKPAIEKEIGDALKSIYAGFILSFPLYEANTDADGLEIKPKTKEITITDSITKKGVGGAVGGSGGAFIGAAIGRRISPVIGPILGGYIGGLFGSKAGAEIAENFVTTRIKKVEIGDNLDEVIESAKISAFELVDQYIRNTTAQLDADIFNPIMGLLKSTEEKIANSITNIQKIIEE